MQTVNEISLHGIHDLHATTGNHGNFHWLKLTFNKGWEEFSVVIHCRPDMLNVVDAINDAMADVRADRSDTAAYRNERSNPDALAHEVR